MRRTILIPLAASALVVGVQPALAGAVHLSPKIASASLPKITAAPSSLKPKASAVVTAQVPLGATCHLTLTLAGKKEAQSPYSKSKGSQVQFTWDVPADVKPGTRKAVISCKGKTHTASAKITAQVKAKSKGKGHLAKAIKVHQVTSNEPPEVAGLGAGSYPAYGSTMIAASQWFGGRGVDVISNGCGDNIDGTCGGVKQPGLNWQCVELTNRFLTSEHFGPSIYGDAGQDYWNNATNSAYVRHPNGTGYVPVPGDVVDLKLSGSKYGHVQVVDAVTANTVYVVEQNASASGRAALSLSGSTLGGIYGMSVIGVIHATANHATASSTSAPTSSPQSGLLGLINSAGAAYVQQGLSGGFTRLTSDGDASAIAVAGTYVMIINSCGAAYATSDFSQGLTQETACGDAKSIAVSNTGVLMIINGCGAAYAKQGVSPANGGFTQETACGDASAIAVGGARLAVINGCGALYAKDGIAPATGGFTQETACGDAQRVAVGSSGRMLVETGCGASYAKDGIAPANGGFTQETACGDTQAVAVGGARIAVINSCGAAYAKDSLEPATGGFTQETACGDTTAVASGTSGRLMIINGCGAAYAKDALEPAQGGFSQETVCGDAKQISVG